MMMMIVIDSEGEIYMRRESIIVDRMQSFQFIYLFFWLRIRATSDSAG